MKGLAIALCAALSRCCGEELPCSEMRQEGDLSVLCVRVEGMVFGEFAAMLREAAMTHPCLVDVVYQGETVRISAYPLLRELPVVVAPCEVDMPEGVLSFDVDGMEAKDATEEQPPAPEKQAEHEEKLYFTHAHSRETGRDYPVLVCRVTPGEDGSALVRRFREKLHPLAEAGVHLIVGAEARMESIVALVKAIPAHVKLRGIVFSALK